jgi:uncharacterized protein with ParB-like and HNH nuclease domain
MIEARTKEIRELLNTGDKKFKVPRYQRNFVWGKDQAIDMLNDLKESESAVFFGTIVLHYTNDNSLQIVDGQQRLTAIFILLAAIRIRAQGLGNHQLANQIQSKISFVNDTTGEDEGARLLTSDKVRDAFENTILWQNWDGNFAIPELKNRKRQVNRIKPIFDIFNEYTSTLDQNDLTTFLNRLHSSYFVSIDIEDEAEAFQVFERSNARGLELNAADLLKNYLFEQMYQNSEEDVEEVWNNIVDYSGSDIIRMLKYYYVTNNGHVQKKELYRKLRNYGSEIGPQNMLHELRRFSYVHAVFTEPTKDALKHLLIEEDGCEYFQDEYRLNDFRYALQALQLFRVTQVYPVLIALYNSYLKTDKSKSVTKKFVQTVQAIESYHFINNAITKHAGNEVEHAYAEIACKITNDLNFEEACEEMRNYLKQNIEGGEQFMSYFSNITYGTDNLGLIYYIFDRFNNVEANGGQIVEIYNPDPKLRKKNYNIEHLLPQSNLNEDDEEFAEDIIHNIGNLIAVPYHSNSAMGNESFESKKEYLRQDSHLEVIHDFMEEYGHLTEWNAEKISERSKKMAELAYNKIWSF